MHVSVCCSRQQQHHPLATVVCGACGSPCTAGAPRADCDSMCIIRISGPPPCLWYHGECGLFQWLSRHRCRGVGPCRVSPARHTSTVATSLRAFQLWQAPPSAITTPLKHVNAALHRRCGDRISAVLPTMCPRQASEHWIFNAAMACDVKLS